LRWVGHLEAEWKILRICVAFEFKLRLAPKRVVVVMMICAGKLVCGMFAGDHVVAMHAVRTRGAMIRQSGSVTRQRGAARAGCRSMTAQAATRAVAAPTAPRVSATATTGVSATATTGVSATATTGVSATTTTAAAGVPATTTTGA
jgi:hypothetical protein